MNLRPGYPTVVDEVTVRLVAGLVTVLAVLGLRFWWLYAALALDFVLRVTFGPRLSPLAQVVLRWIRPRVAAPGRPTPGAPKRFAASIGIALASGAALAGAAAAAGSPSAAIAALVLGWMLVVFPALEAIAGLCVGCLIFARLIGWGLVSEEVCLDCADLSRRAATSAG